MKAFPQISEYMTLSERNEYRKLKEKLFGNDDAVKFAVAEGILTKEEIARYNELMMKLQRWMKDFDEWQQENRPSIFK